MRALTTLVLLLAGAVGLAAQANAPLCYHARPRPLCSGFVFTNFGGYVQLGRDNGGGSPFREVADWGLMINVGEKAAVGGSVFASFDRAGLLVGPSLRYRRWLSGQASVDVAVGTPIVSSTGNIESGSIFGLARWNPNAWVAVAARPELARWTTVTACAPTGCTTTSRYHPRMALGLEVGKIPGAVLTGLAGVATFLLSLAVASSD